MSATETGVAPTDQEIRVLALDGGGIRGLSSLVVLRELMLRIAVAAPDSGPIRPCDYFDLIIGTGTGGLSALFVGRMRMTVDEAIKAYMLMGQEGFRQSAVPWYKRLRKKGALLDGDSLTRIIGDIVHQYLHNRNAPLHEPPRTTETGGRSCKTAVLAATSVNADAPPHVFRSYTTSRDPASTHAIYEVARATTATAGLFPSISLGSPPLKFIDAGVAGYNNPAEEALNEVGRIWPDADISCLVSLGTGLQPIVKVEGTWKGVMKVSRRLVEDCEKVHEQLRRRCLKDGLPYYRFNVTTGLDAPGIPEWDQETDGVIAAVTEGYMRKGEVDGDLDSCVRLLVGKPPAYRTSLRLLKTIIEDGLTEKVFRWLDAPDSSPSYITALEKHQEGTGDWFIHRHDFSRWKKGRGSFLCIHGKPGCGKTVLCSSIITEVKNFCDQGKSCAYAYFFFDGRDAQTTLQRHDSLIRSLIRQFSGKCNGTPAVLVHGYKDGIQQLPTRNLEEILRHIVEGFTDAYIIIDSVDECIERVKLLKWITNLSISKADNVHLLVTTRPEEDIMGALRSLDPTSIAMEEELINGDMEVYLDSKLKEGWLSTRAEEVRLLVKEKLMTRADGMFRWLAIQLDELEKCPNDAELYDQLERLPEDLDETYFRILKRIPKQRRTAAKVFLQWTAFSARSLRLEELGEAAAFELDHDAAPKYNPDRKVEPRDVLVACSSLIIESEGYVKLSHFSVKEYLMSDHISSDTASSFGISERLSHTYISRTCLAYLLRFDSLESLRDDTLPAFPLAWYAAQQWVFHVRSGGKENSPMDQNLIVTLFERGVLLTNWLRLFDPDDPRRMLTTLRSVTTVPNPLYYASLYGFVEVVRGLLDKVPRPDAMHGWDVNSEGDGYGTALKAASREGRVDVVKLLLDRGADVNAEGTEALVSASWEGHIDIVKMLLDRGADVNAGGTDAAESESSEGPGDRLVEIFNMLSDPDFFSDPDLLSDPDLDLDADMDAEHRRFVADVFPEGPFDVAELFLEGGVDIHALPVSSLAKASMAGHSNVVELLLDRGADVNVRDGEALANASLRGNIEIVKILLDRGADVNAGNGKALAYALQREHDEIIQLLLDHGATAPPDIDVPAS